MSHLFDYRWADGEESPGYETALVRVIVEERWKHGLRYCFFDLPESVSLEQVRDRLEKFQAPVNIDDPLVDVVVEVRTPPGAPEYDPWTRTYRRMFGPWTIHNLLKMMIPFEEPTVKRTIGVDPASGTDHSVETILPLGDRVLVRRDEPATHAGAIILPETGKERPQRGTVLAVGPGKYPKGGSQGVVVFNYPAGDAAAKAQAEVNAARIKGRMAITMGRPHQGNWPAVEQTEPGTGVVEVGDRVLFPRFAGSEINHNGEELLILSESEILAVVRPAEGK